jgi:PKD repeat protein
VQFNDANSYDANNDSLAITWIFGDGTGTTQRNPVHTYTQAGDYQALLIVDDGRQGESRDTVIVLVSPLTTFPSAGIIDNFNRANEPLGSPWTADVAGLAVSGNQLVQTSGYGFPIWDGAVFGPDQEAYITFTTISGSAAPERDLVLKAQGTTDVSAHIEVRYDATQHQVDVGTYDPVNGWLVQGTPVPATYLAGDRFGARAYANGQVEVYQNATRIGVRTLTGWPHTASGGRVGLTLDAANKGSFDDFGGGDVVFAVNHPPTAKITSPIDSTFYVVPETIYLRGTKSDVEDPPSQLQTYWDVILHHNTHIHQALSFNGDSAQFATIDHDDGSGVYYEIKMVVTDTGGMHSDTASVSIFPEADLEPSAITTDAGSVGAEVPTHFSFEMRNNGHLLAHRSHWQLLMDNLSLAQGDTLVLPLDSTLIAVTVPANTFTSGMHTLRAVLDTLNSVVETNENNNVTVQPVAVPGNTTGVVSGLPRVLALSQGLPNPSRGEVRFALDLPQPASVGFEVLDIQGRAVMNDVRRSMTAGRWNLRWDGRISGSPAPPGLYVARVRVGGKTMTRRLVLIR